MALSDLLRKSGSPYLTGREQGFLKGLGAPMQLDRQRFRFKVKVLPSGEGFSKKRRAGTGLCGLPSSAFRAGVGVVLPRLILSPRSQHDACSALGRNLGQVCTALLMHSRAIRGENVICLFCSRSPGTSPESPNLKLGSFFRAVALTQLIALNSQLHSSRADSLSCLGACIPVPAGL